MKHIYPGLLLFLSVAVYGQTPISEDQTNTTISADNIQEALIAALATESSADFLKLVPSKKEFATQFSENKMVIMFSEKYKDVDSATIRKNVKAILASDDFYEKFLRSEEAFFNRAIDYGKQIGISWKDAKFKSGKTDSVGNAGIITYQGMIWFISKNKSYIIKHECLKYMNSFFITDVRIPYPDPMVSFKERTTRFVSQINKGYTYGNTFQKEAVDSIFFKLSTLQSYKEKSIINNVTHEEFYLLFLEYKTDKDCKLINEKLFQYARNRKLKGGRTMYLKRDNGIVVFRSSCKGKNTAWTDLHNKLVETFEPSSTISSECSQ